MNNGLWTIKRRTVGSVNTESTCICCGFGPTFRMRATFEVIPHDTLKFCFYYMCDRCNSLYSSRDLVNVTHAFIEELE